VIKFAFFLQAPVLAVLAAIVLSPTLAFATEERDLVIPVAVEYHDLIPVLVIMEAGLD
jgi:hypothetical protein